MSETSTTDPTEISSRSVQQNSSILASISRIAGRHSWKAMALLWLLYAMNGNMRNLIMVIQPSLADEFQLSADTLGLWTGILTSSLGVGAITLATWLDKGGHGWARKYRYLPITAIALLFSLMSGLMPLTMIFGAVMAFQLIKNVASGTAETVEVTSVAEWWPLERRGFAQGLHHTALPWGNLLGGLAVSAIFAIFGPENWRLVFLIIPPLIIPIFICYWRFANARNYAAFVEDTEQRGLTPPLGNTSADDIHAAPGAFKRALKNPNVIVSSIGFGLAAMAYAGLGFWLPLYLAFVAHYDLAVVAAYSVLFTITGGIGQIVWGAISDRLGRKFCLVAMFLWLAVAFYLFQFAGSSVGAMIAIQLFAGMASNGVFPVLYAMASDSSERGAVGIGNGLNQGGLILGGLGPFLIGWLIQAGGGYSSTSGFMYSLYALSAIMAFAAIMIALFTRETLGRFQDHDRALVSKKSCLRADVMTR